MTWAQKCTQCPNYFPPGELEDGRCPRHRLVEGRQATPAPEARTPVRIPRGEVSKLTTRWCPRCGRREQIWALEGGVCPDCRQIKQQAKLLAKLRAGRSR